MLTMWKKKKDYFRFPHENGNHYTTIQFLKSLANSELVRLRKVIGLTHAWHVTATPNLTKPMYLCRKGSDVLRSTFVQYERIDGKPEETRIDRLIQVE